MKTISSFDIFMMGFISVLFAIFFGTSMLIYPGDYFILGMLLLAFFIIVLFIYGQLIKNYIIIGMSYIILSFSFLSIIIVRLIVEGMMPNLGFLIIMTFLGIFGSLAAISVYQEYSSIKENSQTPEASPSERNGE